MLLIGDVAARTGLSIDALRYYEREGLLGPVARDTGGRRRYDPDSLHLLDVLLCLRRTGMPVRQSREFADLVRTGPGTVPDRVEILRAHREAVVERMRQLEADLAVIDGKLTTYTGG
jgi:DNA-binding transcriptional MerR regulator